MCVPLIPALIAGAAIAGGGLAYAGASKQASATQAAAQQNEKAAASNAQMADEQFNQANQKTPDIAGMFARNREAGAQGMGATFLTGANGAGLLAGNLGKNTLLGS